MGRIFNKKLGKLSLKLVLKLFFYLLILFFISVMASSLLFWMGLLEALTMVILFGIGLLSWIIFFFFFCII